MALSPLALVTQVLTMNAPKGAKGNEQVDLFISKEGLPYWRQIRNLFNNLITNLNAGTLQIFGALVRFGTGAPTQADPDGSIYVRQDPGSAQTFLYYRFGGAWILFTGAGGGGGVAISAGTTQATSGTVSFANSNGLSFGLNAQTLTAQFGYAVSAGTTNTTGSALSFSNSPTVTFGLNGNTVTASAAGGGITNINVSAGTTSNFLSAITFSNANNFNWGLNGSVITAIAPFSISAGIAQANLQSVTFSDSNNFSFGLLGGVITGRFGYAVSAGTTNTTGSALSFSNSPTVTFGLNGNTITASAAGGGLMSFSAGTSSVALNSLVFSDTRNVSFGLNGSTVTGSVIVRIGAGTTASNATAFIFLDGNNVSFGMAGANITAIAPQRISAGTTNGTATNWSYADSNGVSFGLNGSTITASVAAFPAQVSFWRPFVGENSTISNQYGNGSVFVSYPVHLVPFTASAANMFVSFGMTTATNSTYSGTLSAYMGVYTRNVSTLSLASSGSQSFTFTGSSNVATGSLNGLRMLTIPININYTGGLDLWVGLMSRTSSAGQNVWAGSNIMMSGISLILSGQIGQASNNTYQILPGCGIFSVSSSSMPVSMAFTAISGHGSGPKMPPLMNFYNMTA